MIPFFVGVLAVAVILAFLAVVALVASMLVLSGSEPLSPWDTEESECPRCEGTGIYNWRPCSLCDGNGKISEASLQVEVVDRGEQ